MFSRLWLKRLVVATSLVMFLVTIFGLGSATQWSGRSTTAVHLLAPVEPPSSAASSRTTPWRTTAASSSRTRQRALRPRHPSPSPALRDDAEEGRLCVDLRLNETAARHLVDKVVACDVWRGAQSLRSARWAVVSLYPKKGSCASSQPPLVRRALSANKTLSDEVYAAQGPFLLRMRLEGDRVARVLRSRFDVARCVYLFTWRADDWGGVQRTPGPVGRVGMLDHAAGEAEMTEVVAGGVYRLSLEVLYADYRALDEMNHAEWPPLLKQPVLPLASGFRSRYHLQQCTRPSVYLWRSVVGGKELVVTTAGSSGEVASSDRQGADKEEVVGAESSGFSVSADVGDLSWALADCPGATAAPSSSPAGIACDGVSEFRSFGLVAASAGRWEAMPCALSPPAPGDDEHGAGGGGGATSRLGWPRLYTRVRVRKIQREPIVFEWALQPDKDWRWLSDVCRHDAAGRPNVMATLAGRRIVVGGDSQLRALYFGMVNVLSGLEWPCVRNISSIKEEPRVCIANVKGSQRKTVTFTDEADHGETRPRGGTKATLQIDFVDDTFLDKLGGNRYEGYDVVIVGMGQHPASKEHWSVDKYRRTIVGKAARLGQIHAKPLAGRNKLPVVLWYSAPQYPHTQAGFPVAVRDWRTDARLQLFNQIATEIMHGLHPPIPVVDAFPLTNAMSHTSPDQAHYTNFVSAELVRVTLSIAVSNIRKHQAASSEP